LNKTYSAMDRLGGRDESGGAFDTAHQMGKVRAGDAGMAAAAGSYATGVLQGVYGKSECLFINMVKRRHK
jgi:hypothetical protein